MKLPIYKVDAFAEKAFTGNPAAVVPLQGWLPDNLMQAVAEENNLAETAFLVPEGEGFRIRWFTPAVEVNLCGHATLASAHVLFSELGFAGKNLAFQSRSGPLAVKCVASDQYQMGFPAQVSRETELPEGLLEGMGEGFNKEIVEVCLFNEDYLLILNSEQAVRDVKPDFNLLAKVAARGIIVSAVAAEFDFVCRFFGPAVGVNEDAVTGSAFTKLIPYWAKRLGRNTLSARQVSWRGGNIDCEIDGDVVFLTGRAATFLRGEITLP